MALDETHVPVMLNEVIQALAPKQQEIYIDGTFGYGGYTRAILQKTGCTVYGIDRDPDVLHHAKAIETEFAGRFHFIQGRYGDMQELLSECGVEKVHGVVLDIGVSSAQIDQPDRGFSFKQDGPLDMRMEKVGESAADIVNTYPEEELADILWRLGEERKSRAIARAIVRRREEELFTTTQDLRQIVHRVLPKKSKKDPATRTFQALRLYVNDELGELERGLQAAERLLEPEGRLVVVSFHSLEDRLVKNFMRPFAPGRGTSRHLPVIEEEAREAPFKPLYSKALKPSRDEILQNPRARSAKLRAAIRVMPSKRSEEG